MRNQIDSLQGQIDAGGLGSWESGAGNDIYYNAGDVGIGVTNPTKKLQVAGGNVEIDGSGTIGGSNVGNAWLLFGSGTSGLGIDPNEIYTAGQDLNIGAVGNRVVNINTNGSNRIRVQGNGNVGISESAPADRLEVMGNIRTSGNAPRLRFQENDGNANQNFQLAMASGELCFQTANDDDFSSASSRMTIEANGEVGIGTTNPAGLLHVNGSSPTVRISGTGTSNWAGSTLFMEALGATAANRFNQVMFTTNRGTDGEANFAMQRRDDGAYQGRHY